MVDSVTSVTTPAICSLEVDLERLSRLARDDPPAFERERRRLIDACIDGSPEEDRAMLRRLQFRADGARRRCRSALQSSLRMSAMMWASFHAMNARLNPPAGRTNADSANSARSATVLPLHRPKCGRGSGPAD